MTCVSCFNRYITPEQVPIQYGGLSKDGDDNEFTTEDATTELVLKPTSKHTIEIPAAEVSMIAWLQRFEIYLANRE